jgi:hypothetical protein
MKNSLKTLIALLFVGATMTSAVPVKAADITNHITTLKLVKNISKVVVSGNINLILIQDANESVKVYDKYYSKNALVQQQGGTLRVSSFQEKPLDVVVYVKNLAAIEASNGARIKTEGNFKLLNLDVKLSGNAKADIYANTVNLYTSVKDASDLKIAGTTESHIVEMGDLGNMTMNKLVAHETIISSKSTIALAKR